MFFFVAISPEKSQKNGKHWTIGKKEANGPQRRFYSQDFGVKFFRESKIVSQIAKDGGTGKALKALFKHSIKAMIACWVKFVRKEF